VGRTSNWVYPLYLQGNDGSCPTRAAIEKSGEIILVESIGDCVSLYNEDFQNCLVTFGLTISSKLICALTELSPSKIYLSFNNDRGSAENRGLIAAIKNYCKLLRYFDHSKLQICLPNKKDFGDMNQEDFCEWKKKSESINQDDLIKHIKKQADILYESRKLSANLYKNLKVLPL
jgi:DNA primase